MTKKFSETLCNLYIVVLSAIMPLYNRGTYVMIGDTKFDMFRDVSLWCLCLAVLSAVVGMIESRPAKGAPDGFFAAKRTGARAFSYVDLCVACYGVSAALSAFLSSYGVYAWTGYREWHMGALTQLSLTAIYFFVSRCYNGSAWTVYMWEAAFFLTALLGLCSRLGMDPLGLLRDFERGGWEYRHLISTVGNINWYCGYSAVAIAMPTVGYLKAKSVKKRIILYIVSVLGLVVLCIQGSDAGPVLVFVCLGVCLLWGGRNESIFARTMLLAAGTCLGLPCYANAVRLAGERAFYAIPEDGIGLRVFGWGGWWALGALFLGIYFLIKNGMKADAKMRDTKQGRGVAGRIRAFWIAAVIMWGIFLLLGVLLCLSRLAGSVEWNQGRGVLWRLSVQGFLKGDWKQKMFGAGPDCFAEYIYSVFSPGELPEPEGHWAGAIFANAHNQWLNHLVNTGIFGLLSAVAIVIAALKRYRRFMPGMLALILYCVNSLVSFQQVLSTPLIFVMLGICEYRQRVMENKISRLDGGTGDSYEVDKISD